ncbi:MFS transporter [Silvanigrella aquatica]|uniref:Major facilitator superfamily (MFS) profile domain-containing protein n=1 Tax=Silvanigrella aquatica TaxID=1915309 RepID=A0A1L4CYT6_9BACT|nr:MFS transporter [Silvanigrella aquatica]APJ03116.1 hypothetical protein AXG55_04010 [Silvanigrella aquatica]
MQILDRNFFRILSSINFKKIGVILATCLTIFTSNSSLTEVNLSLPIIAREFQTDMSVMPWVISIYIIVAGMFMIIGGKLGDYIGTKRVFIFSLLLWLISLIMAGCSNSILILIIARIIEGVAFALSLPISIVVISKTFSEKQLGLAVSINITVMGLAQAIGPTLGGYLLQYFGWRWIFFINVPFILFAIIFSTLCIKPDILKHRKPILDYFGAIILAISLCFIMIFLDIIQKNSSNFQLISICLFILFFTFGILYYVEKKASNPIIDFKLLFNKDFFIINLLRMLFQFIYFSVLFILPIYLLDILNYSPVKSGYFLLSMTIPFACLSIIIGKISDKIGEKLFVTLSFLIAAIAFYLSINLNENPSYIMIIMPLLLLGISSAFMFNSSTSMALKIASPEKKGAASGIFFTNTLIGGAIGVAVTSLALQLLKHNFYSTHTNLNLPYENTPTNSQVFLYAFSGLMWMFLAISIFGFFISLFNYRHKIITYLNLKKDFS